jgi:protein arginine N-methyltransferase 7
MNEEQQLQLQQTIHSATYRDVVSVSLKEEGQSVSGGDHVTEDDGTGMSTELVLVASLDQQNGGLTWNSLTQEQDEKKGKDDSTTSKVLVGASCDERSSQDDRTTMKSYPKDPALQRHLATKQWIMPMLHDQRRNDLYSQAIERACEEVWKRMESQSSQAQRSSRCWHTLDIGTGTGLLAMLVAKHSTNTYATTTRQVVKEQRQNATSSIDSSDAASHNCPPHVDITTMEMSSAMARLARCVLNDNDFGAHDAKSHENSSSTTGLSVSASITLKEGHTCSPDVTFEKKTMLCTSELLESGLLGEGWLPTMRDAWERHLHPHAVVVPCRARIIAQVVEGGTFVSNYRGPYTYSSSKNCDVSFSTIPQKGIDQCDEDEKSNSKNISGDWMQGPCTVPMHLDALFQLKEEDRDGASPKVRALSDPVTVLEFDFSSPDALPPPHGRFQSQSVSCKHSGLANGVVFWWEMDLFKDSDGGGESSMALTYTTAADQQHPWQDHWQQALYVPKKSVALQQGSSFTLDSFHNDSRVGFHIGGSTSSDSTTTVPDPNSSSDTAALPNSKRPKLDQDGGSDLEPKCLSSLNHSNMCTPERAFQLNDADRLKKLEESIGHSLHKLAIEVNASSDNKIKDNNIVVLDVSDFSLCAILAAKAQVNMNGVNVFVNSIESRGADLPMLSAKVAQFGNGLNNPETFQIINAHPEQLTQVDTFLGCQAATLVVAEPYYEQLEGYHLIEALNYYYTLRGLRQRGLVAPGALSVPMHASIKVCAVEFEQVADVYRALPHDEGGDGVSICGFDHAAVNHYHSESTTNLYLPLWQYKYKKLSPDVEVAKLSYEGGMEITGINAWHEIPFTSAPGTCHGIVLWVEYGLRVPGFENCGELQEDFAPNVTTISTMTSSHNQLVRLFCENTEGPHSSRNTTNSHMNVKFCCEDTCTGAGDFDLTTSRD